jgi:hypothetical protein
MNKSTVHNPIFVRRYLHHFKLNLKRKIGEVEKASPNYLCLACCIVLCVGCFEIHPELIKINNRNFNFSHFTTKKLAHYRQVHFLFILRTLKLNSENLKMKKTKVVRIDS